MIEKIPVACRQYLAEFGHCAIAISAAGRIIVTADPSLSTKNISGGNREALRVRT